LRAANSKIGGNLAVDHTDFGGDACFFIVRGVFARADAQNVKIGKAKQRKN
jgi:hypothetical protein